MNDHDIDNVAKILTNWNPLGADAANVDDLNNYHTEAIDILFFMEDSRRLDKTTTIVQQIINEAFNLYLTKAECKEPAKQIIAALKKKR